MMPVNSLRLVRNGMSSGKYEYNLLASCEWNAVAAAQNEVRRLLVSLGDSSPKVERTIARGIIGVRTSLDARNIVGTLTELVAQDPAAVSQILKLRPVDLWVSSELVAMKEAVLRLRQSIKRGEKWRMEVEKRRFTKLHTAEIVGPLADLIDEKVDLENPDKILRIEILGNSAAVSVLKPEETFSFQKVHQHLPMKTEEA